MYDIYEGCGIVYQIEKYLSYGLNLLFSWSMKNRLADAKYFEKLEKEKLELFIRTDWQGFFSKNEPIELTEEVKAKITDVFDSLLEPIDSQLDLKGYIDGINEYVNYLVYLDTILSWFFYKIGEESTKSEVFQTVLKYYRFLGSEVEKRGYLIPEPWNVQPLARYNRNREIDKARVRGLERKKQEITSRGPCPECGSRGSDIMSYGQQWHCKQCGRRWLKNPRRKKY